MTFTVRLPQAIFGEGVLGSVVTENLKQMYVINVHAMKSALANIGETELSATAFKLEQEGKAKDIAVMMAETPAFLEALREMIEKNKPKEDDRDAKELLDTIALHLLHCNFEDAAELANNYARGER